MRMKRVWGIFLAALALLLPARLYQQFFLVDRSTGFYTDRGASSGCITAVLLLSVLLIVCFTAREKDHPTGMAPTLHSLGGAAIAMFCGFVFLGESIYSLLASPSVDNMTMNAFLSAGGMAAGVVVLLTAYDLATGVNHLDDFPFLGLFPPLWGCLCLIGMFITYTAVVNAIENLYDTCTVIFLLLFLFSYSKYMAGLGGSRKLFIYGFPAVLLAAVTGFPAFMLALAGVDLSSAFPVGLHLLNLALAFYILALLCAVYKREGKRALPPKRFGKPVFTENKEEPPLPVPFVPDQPEADVYWNPLAEEKCRRFLENLDGKTVFQTRRKSPYDEKF